MKKIVCNICQGSSFRMINSDEYECQGCGIVYTADQMRSLLKDASGQKTEESIRDEEKEDSEEKTVSEEITVSVEKKTSVAEKEETAAEKEKKRAEQIEFYSRIAKRVKKQCPKCGSKNIEVNGVFVNRKKGLGYYLTGQAAYEMGMKHGSIIAGALGYHEPNAKCHDCGCEWNA